MLWLQFSNVSMHLFDSLVPEWKQCNLKYSRSESVPKPWWGTCQNCHDNSKFSSKILIQGANYSQKEWKKIKLKRIKGILLFNAGKFPLGWVKSWYSFLLLTDKKAKGNDVTQEKKQNSSRFVGCHFDTHKKSVRHIFVISPGVYWVRVSVQISAFLI